MKSKCNFSNISTSQADLSSGDRAFDFQNEVERLHKSEDLFLKRDIRKQRAYLSMWTFVLITAWLFFVGVALYIVARQSHLSDVVLCTLLTTTTANVLGLPFIILRGLFKTNL